MRRNLDSAGQTGMDFTAVDQEGNGPVVSQADVQELTRRLRGAGWVNAVGLAGLLGPGWSDRKVRAVARAATPGIVSHPGSPGYKLWEECSVEEITRAIDVFKSQARDMQARAMLYESAYHSRYRGTGS